MNQFSLKILAANKVFYDGPAESVTVPQYDGDKQVLANHENMVIALTDGVVKFKIPGGEEREAITGLGFIEIIHNQVTILVESAERPEDIDRVRAQEAADRAQEHMRERQSVREYYHSRASLARAMARLKATSRKSSP